MKRRNILLTSLLFMTLEAAAMEWTGLTPAEGLGFSSGARLGLFPPSFKATRMMRPESGESRIAVIYP